MTLVYAKIINMCRAGAGGWGSRGVKGVHGNFQNWGQHIHGCLMGWGCMYVQLGVGVGAKGGVSEHETKICVRQGKAVGGLRRESRRGCLKISKTILHVCGTCFLDSIDPQKLIWIDTQGSLTHIVEIFKFENVSGDRGTKWPKLNHWLKIVNYFTCVWHFSCR